jgi:TatD DNase family protein
MPTLDKAGRHPKCRAIGEIGLDYHYDHSPRDIQKSALKLQLDLARQLGLPVVIHSRDGEEDLLQALTDYSKQLTTGSIPGIIHCFSGTVAFGQACLDLGFYISFSGILTFKKADEVRTAAQLFPLDKILVETDAPFLAPIPHRGRKCEPSMVRLTALKLAELKGISFEEVARTTTANSKRVFRI